jgi:hypothetical protein
MTNSSAILAITSDSPRNNSPGQLRKPIIIPLHKCYLCKAVWAKGKNMTEKKRKGGLDCPHCQKHIDAAIVARAMFSAGHWENTGRKKILRPCPKGCGKEFGAREMKAHIPRCDGPPAAPPAPHPRTGTRR